MSDVITLNKQQKLVDSFAQHSRIKAAESLLLSFRHVDVKVRR
jgi:hypothetical protein